MSNGTKTSDLTYTLQGGWDNTRMVFCAPTIGIARRVVKVRIRHHTDRLNPEMYIEQFHIDIDGKDTIIDANEWYSPDLARKVWNIFVNLDKKIARNKWVRI